MFQELDEASMNSFLGHISKSRKIYEQGVAAAMSSGNKDVAGLFEANLGSLEANIGNASAAREAAHRAVTISRTSDVQLISALVLAFAGDVSGSQAIIDDFAKGVAPENTVMHGMFFPTLRAQIELYRGNAAASIELLQPVAQYESGGILILGPAYLRGNAYLALKKGKEAAAEFQKVIDHPGIVQDSMTAPLSRLGLARARAMEGDSAGARTAYQDFFALWKDADTDIPILKEAKAEYAKLQ